MTSALPHVGPAVLPPALWSRPLLTAAEEVDLARAAEAGALAADRLAHPRAGDDPAALGRLVREGEQAFHELVMANTRLVAWLARRRLAAGDTTLAYADLYAEGLPGLIRAVHKWDFTHGTKFSTYAVRWITSFQARAVLRARGVPEAVHEQQRAIARARAELAQELGRTPHEPEVARRVGLSTARIAELESYRAPLSLDRGFDQDEERTLADRLADPGAFPGGGEEQDRAATLVSDLLTQLPDRQRRVLTLHFGLDGQQPATVEQIASRCQVHPRRAQHALDQALLALRTLATDPDQED